MQRGQKVKQQLDLKVAFWLDHQLLQRQVLAPSVTSEQPDLAAYICHSTRQGPRLT